MFLQIYDKITEKKDLLPLSTDSAVCQMHANKYKCCIDSATTEQNLNIVMSIYFSQRSQWVNPEYTHFQFFLFFLHTNVKHTCILSSSKILIFLTIQRI
jgi:hypothetical protein